MTQYVYVDILENVVLPYAEEEMPLMWCYQMDNDTKHTSCKANRWFQENKVTLLESRHIRRT